MGNRAGIHRHSGGTVFRLLKTGPLTRGNRELLNNKQRPRWTKATVGCGSFAERSNAEIAPQRRSLIMSPITVTSQSSHTGCGEMPSETER